MSRYTIFAILIGFIAILFANLTYIYGYTVSKPDLGFLGRKVINSQDTYTYVAFIEQARQGRVLFENLYTSEPQSLSLFRPLYIVLGKLALLFNVQSVYVYHIGRVVLAFIFCFVLYRFLRYFFEKPGERLFAYSVVLLSTGLGFILGQLFPQSSDLWIPESNTFLSFGEAPHFIFSQILMLIAFMSFIKGVEEKRTYNFIVSSIALLLLTFEHPFNIVITFSVLLVLTIIFARKGQLNQSIAWGVALTMGIQIIAALYQLYGSFNNSVLNQWVQNNILPSPNPINFIVGYGLLIPFALIGIEQVLKKHSIWFFLTIIWVVVTFVLLYSPLAFQRRVSEGVHIPLAILSSVGLITVAKYASGFVVEGIKKKVYYAFLVGAVLVLSIGSFSIAVLETTTVSRDTIDQYYYYLAQPELAALNTFRDNTSYKDVLLANWFYGNVAPGITGRKTYLGHRIQTINFDKKTNEINKFLLEKDDKKSYRFLKNNGITFIFLGINDSMVRYGFNPASRSYLEKAYDYQGVRIYHVK